jgi:hypothetical protein
MAYRNKLHQNKVPISTVSSTLQVLAITVESQASKFFTVISLTESFMIRL